jgi:hypothetical protein
MEKEEQKTFVTSLMSAMTKEIMDLIDNGKIPEEWDGIELRWLIRDKAAGIVGKRIGTLTRRRDYNNRVLVDNL